MSDLKKADLLSALAGLDAAAEQVITQAETRGGTLWLAKSLDSARFFKEPVRLAVDRVREETGDFTHEALLHEKARRLHAEFTGEGEPSWEVKGWREAERLETGERVFEVQLLGIALPVDGEELIPVERRTDDSSTGRVEFIKGQTGQAPEVPVVFDAAHLEEAPGYFVDKPSDFCECGHTRGSHSDAGLHSCLLDRCECEQFRLMASGVEGVEEMPPAPESDLPERPALHFLEELHAEAGIPELDPITIMALQRLVIRGWRFTPPKD